MIVRLLLKLAILQAIITVLTTFSAVIFLDIYEINTILNGMLLVTEFAVKDTLSILLRRLFFSLRIRRPLIRLLITPIKRKASRQKIVRQR
jgi:hypothetical protein